jgi:hypothetical protein
MSDNPVYRDGAVHICAHKCATCIYRPGNLMFLEAGRKDSMEAEAVANESVIPCHKTLGPGAAICRGYWDTQWRNIFPLRMAVVMKNVREIDPDNKERDE